MPRAWYEKGKWQRVGGNFSASLGHACYAYVRPVTGGRWRWFTLDLREGAAAPPNDHEGYADSKGKAMWEAISVGCK